MTDINPMNATNLLQMINGSTPVDLSVDITQDGQITLDDVLALQKHEVGLSPNEFVTNFNNNFNNPQPNYNFDAFGFNPTFTNPDGSIVFEGKGGISTVAPDLATANQQYLDTITQQLTSDVADLQGTNGVNPYIGQNLDAIQNMGDMYQRVTGNAFSGLNDALTAFNAPASGSIKDDLQNNPNFQLTTMAAGEEDGVGQPTMNQQQLQEQALAQAVMVDPTDINPNAYTRAIGEDGSGIAMAEPSPFMGTLAVGEDNTPVFGATLNEIPQLQAVGIPATRAIGEDGQGGFTPMETVTTAAMGEEGNMPSELGMLKPVAEATTRALGEEGDFPPPMMATTQAMGEEEGDFAPIGNPPFAVTMAIGETDGAVMPSQPRPPNPFLGLQPPMQQPYNPYGGGYNTGYGMQQPGGKGGGYGQPQPYYPQPQPRPPMGGGKGGGYQPQPQPYYPQPQPQPPMGGGKGGGYQPQPQPFMPQPQPQPQPQPGGKGGGQPSTGGGMATTQAMYEDDFAPLPGQQSSGGGFLGQLGAGSLLGSQQNTGGSSNNASPFGGSSGGGSRTAMF